jgi:beta-lactamase regulating signal transducer with metallopeptidase domain
MMPHDSTLISALGLAIVHFLWQGAIIGLVSAALLHGLHQRSPQARYAITCGSMIACLVAFIATFLWLMPSANTFSGAETAPVLPTPTSIGLLTESNSNVVEIVAWGWVIGVLMMMGRFTRHWLWSRRLRTRMISEPDEQWQRTFHALKEELGISKGVRLLRSGLAEIPMVIGWVAPIILVPASAFISLTPDQLRSILAHELAHIRRHDHWVNMFQGLIEIILFFHPAVWWISKQLHIEREYCCDDSSVTVIGDPKILAGALTQLEALRISSPRNALAANGGSFMERITRILGTRRKPKELKTMKTKINTLGTIIAAFLFLGGLFLVQAQADILAKKNERNPTPSPEVDHLLGKKEDRRAKDEQLQFHQWQKQVNCLSCHGTEKKKADWKLFPLHKQGKLSEKKWLKKTDCFSCHPAQKGKGLLLWPSLHKFNLPKKKHPHPLEESK